MKLKFLTLLKKFELPTKIRDIKKNPPLIISVRDLKIRD